MDSAIQLLNNQGQKFLHVPFLLQWGDFCWEGSGHFRSSGEQIWKLLCGVIGPISTPNDYLNTAFDDVVSLCRSCRNNYALPQSVRDKLKLVATFSLWCMWNIALSNKNILTWIVRRALNAIINRNKTETLFALQVLGNRILLLKKVLKTSKLILSHFVQNNGNFWIFRLDQISHVSTVILYLGGQGDGIELFKCPS